MITFKLTEDNEVLWEIIVSGHANNESPGKEAICAAVSMATIITGNAIKYLGLDNYIHIDLKEGYFRIIADDRNDTVDALLLNLGHTLSDLKVQYPESIQETNLYSRVSMVDIDSEDLTPEEALNILGSIPLEDGVHPILNLPSQCKTINCVKNAYSVVESALKDLKILKSRKMFESKEKTIKIDEDAVVYSEEDITKYKSLCEKYDFIEYDNILRGIIQMEEATDCIDEIIDFADYIFNTYFTINI